MDALPMENEWLNEFCAFKKWKFGFTKSDLKMIFNKKGLTELSEYEKSCLRIDGIMLFGDPASAFFTFNNDVLSKVTLLWESQTSGAYVSSKIKHVKEILDKEYGASQANEHSMQWDTKELRLILGIETASGKMIAQFQPI